MVSHKFSQRLSSGFSLIELMVALVIFSVGLAGLVVLQSRLTLAEHNVNLQQIALSIATDRMNALRSKDYDNADLAVTSVPAPPATPAEQDTKFFVSTNITLGNSDADYPELQYKIITVTVTWTNSNQRPKKVVLSTVKADLNSIYSIPPEPPSSLELASSNIAGGGGP